MPVPVEIQRQPYVCHSLSVWLVSPSLLVLAGHWCIVAVQLPGWLPKIVP